jgi:protein YIPF5/7
LLFGFSLLASGKVHFGYIYGLALLGSTLLHFILSLMSPPLPATVDPTAAHDKPPSGGHFSSSLTYPRSASVLGYCLLPLVLISVLGIAFPMDSLFGYILTTAAIAWCTYSSSAMFCSVGRMSDMGLLVAYPLALFYVSFGIMAIFSSRGTGSLEAKVGG